MRALVARFWATPYRPARLARWGTELHDRFMLPHFVWQDLGDVVAELNDAGYRVRARLVRAAPRFPLPAARRLRRRGRRRSSCAWRSSRGTCSARRAAPAARRATSTRRVERIEVHVQRARRRSPRARLQRPAPAAAADRHASASSSPACAIAPGPRRRRCTRRSPPRAARLRPGRHLDRAARSAAASTTSRIRAAAATHLPGQRLRGRGDVPLVFDLVDTWMQRSLGGCQYHVAHPGGINYTTFPVNAYEAEARRLARFFRTGHTPGTLILPAEAAEPRLSAHPRSAPARPRRRSVPSRTDAGPTPRRLRGARGPLRRAARGARAAAAALGRVPARARRAQRARGERHARRSPSGRSASTASPTTSTPTRRACTGRGRSTRSRWCCRPTSGQTIAAGIEQRADLLNRVLGDLYGAQTLLKSGAIPPPVIFGHRGFLAPAAGHPAGRRPSPAAVRRRPRALARRPLVGRQRPHAGALGRRATRSRTGSSSRASSRRCSASCRCSTSRRFFDALRDVAAALGAARRRRRPRDRPAHARARTTRPTSSTRCSRATSASRSSRATTSRCATTASG